MNRTGWAIYEVTRRVVLLAVAVGVLGMVLADGPGVERQMAELQAVETAAPQPLVPAPDPEENAAT